MKKVKTLLYCKKTKPLMEKSDDTCYEIGMSSRYIIGNDRLEIVKPLNGKIVCECDIETEEIECVKADFNDFIEYHYITKHLQEKELIKRSCVDFPKLQDYLRLNNGYALHLSNLNIFDKPLELKDTYTRECNWNKCSKCEYGKDGNIKCCTIDIPLSKAPQNMMWVWYKGERYVLISIQSKWLCKILNGEKTIECRKRILKEMMSK